MAAQVRVQQSGLNKGGKNVKAGMFDYKQSNAADTSLSIVPEPLSDEMNDYLRELPYEHQYANSVTGHEMLGEIAASVRSKHPDSQSFLIGLDFSECEDDFDEPSPYLDAIVMKDGSVQDFDGSFEEIRDNLMDVNWGQQETYSAAGHSVDYGAGVKINIDQALNPPKYLTDPSHYTATPVPSTVADGGTFSKGNTLEAVEYHRRVAANHPHLVDAPDSEAVQELRAKLDTQAEQRIAELKAAGVSR